MTADAQGAAPVQTDLFGSPDPSEAAAPGTGSVTSAHAATTGPGTAARKRGASYVSPSPCLPVTVPPPLLARAGEARADGLYLGTSSWSFPGWQGLLYQDHYSATALARDGLAAYAASDLLHSVGIDRSFYAPLTPDEYRSYADQVPAHFRFVVKAPSRVCDAAIRGARGAPAQANPDFLNAALAVETFVRPCIEGLADKAGALVFQLSPLPDAWLADTQRLIDRLARFFDALPTLTSSAYALEIRDAALLTPRLIRMLKERGVRYCVGIHSRMPDVRRQAAALALLDSDVNGDADVGGDRAAPLIVRWSLHAGMRYEGAKTRYEPFDAIVDADPATREALADLIARTLHARQKAFVIVNNKAEGSSPLSCAWLALAVADALRTLSTNAAADADMSAGADPGTTALQHRSRG